MKVLLFKYRASRHHVHLSRGLPVTGKPPGTPPEALGLHAPAGALYFEAFPCKPLTTSSAQATPVGASVVKRAS